MSVEHHDQLDTGVIVGVTTGSIVGVALLLLLAVVLFRKIRPFREHTEELESQDGTELKTVLSLEAEAEAASNTPVVVLSPATEEPDTAAVTWARFTDSTIDENGLCRSGLTVPFTGKHEHTDSNILATFMPRTPVIRALMTRSSMSTLDLGEAAVKRV